MSHQLLQPGRKLVSNISFSGKFILLGVIFIIPLIFLLWSSYTTQGVSIDFSAREREGLRLIDPARQLLQPLLLRRSSAQALIGGDPGAQTALEKSTQAVDQRLALLASAEQATANKLDTQAAFDKIKTQWLAVKEKPAASVSESQTLHSELIQQILAYMGLVADQSNLTLDPDIDTFYLMDAITVRLPIVTETTAKLRSLASSVASRKVLGMEDRVQLNVLLQTLLDHTGAVNDGTAKSFKANPGVASAVSHALAVMQQSNARFTQQIREQILNTASIDIAAGNLEQAGQQAIDDAFALHDAISPKLDSLIALRVAGLEDYLTRQFIIVGLSMLVVLYLFLSLRGLILASVQGLLDGSRRIAGGDFSTKVEASSQDELGTLAASLNTVQQQLGEKITAEEKMVAEMLRIRFAIDSVSVPVTLLDEANVLIYLNQAARSLWQTLLAEPDERVESLLGQSLLEYFADETARHTLAAPLAAARSIDTTLNGRHLRLLLNPVRDTEGRQAGKVVQWLDRTQELTIEEEVEAIIDAAGRGDFTTRLDTAGKEGFFLALAEGLNKLSGTTASGLAEVAAVLRAIAQGNLTKTVDAQFEGLFAQLQSDTNLTVEKLRDVVTRIKDAADNINTAAGEIASGNADLSSRTEEQASSLEETASSMEEINTTVRQNAENALQANRLAEKASTVASEGGAMVKAVVQTMSGIQSSSQKIADIISVIDGIAFQTNILALNAAVEAARAGEQGRGFAVVATEVRNLAQRSATAAKEIKTLISDSVEKVDAGAKQVNQAGSTMEQLVSSVRQVAQLLTDISHASREQATGVEQVTQGIGKMEQVTQQNAALVEEAAAAAESLEEQARTLVGTVSLFHLSGSSPAVQQPGQRQVAALSAPSRPVLPVKTITPTPAEPKRLAPPVVDDSGDEWAEF